MAHGQDVANLGRIPGVTAATRWVLGRSSAVIANSRWLADRLTEPDRRRPRARSRSLDLRSRSRGVLAPPRGRGATRARLGGRGPGLPLRRLADRAEERGAPGRRLRLTGPGAARLRRRRAPARSSSREGPNVTLAGRIPQSEVPRWVAACDVLCQPSLIEPFGQATLEAMAMERTVVATSNGGPPEFVTPEAGRTGRPAGPRRTPPRSGARGEPANAQPGCPPGGRRA